jgi:hypothetical protein
MKVRCKKILDVFGNTVDSSAWLQVGNEYLVSSVLIDHGIVKIRIVGEEPTPILVEIEMFEVIKFNLPTSWVVKMPSPNNLLFSPEAWPKEGFWVDYFNQEPSAIQIFNEEYKFIKSNDLMSC